MKTVLAFDQASNYSGWALGKNNSVIECGTIDTSPRRFDSIGSRFLRLSKAVRELIEDHRPDLIVIEEHRRHSSTQAAQMLGGAAALVLSLAEEHNVPAMAVPVMTLKRFWTGTGNASKELMLAVARKKCDRVTVKNDDEADACAMAMWGFSQI
jgi:Holliday junction resolvasome RuvABC endonuclease subunit